MKCRRIPDSCGFLDSRSRCRQQRRAARVLAWRCRWPVHGTGVLTGAPHGPRCGRDSDPGRNCQSRRPTASTPTTMLRMVPLPRADAQERKGAAASPPPCSDSETGEGTTRIERRKTPVFRRAMGWWSGRPAGPGFAKSLRPYSKAPQLQRPGSRFPTPRLASPDHPSAGTASSGRAAFSFSIPSMLSAIDS